jgi:transposase, IS5 family
MQAPIEKTTKMLLMNTEEDVFNSIIETNHPFRKLNEIIDFNRLVTPLQDLYSKTGAVGINVEKGIKALLIQFWEDYSDRQMEKALRENMAIRWFCGFGITEQTPDFSYFSKLRKRIGTKETANLFNRVNIILKQYGLFGNVFTFIDASAIVTKTALWSERDKAIKDGAEKLNNAVVSKYAADKDARWGAKGKNKIWFGYKRHEAVDMRHGLVKKVATTPANVLDNQVVKSVCPAQGAVFADKLYDTKRATGIIKGNGCHPSTIQKNNNKEKNRDLDRWRSAIRMPFEGTFSKRQRRARYRGRTKVTMQCFLEAIIHNLKKAVRFTPHVTLLAPA